MPVDVDSILEETDLYTWSIRRRLLRGQPFTIIPPLKHIYRDPSTEVYIEKPAQVFISEYLISLALFTCCSGWGGRGNALYVFPATPQIADFSNGRLEPVILESPYLRAQRQKIKDATGFTATNNVQLKQLGRGFIYLRGSNARNQIVSVDADVVELDEVDEMEEGTIEAAKRRASSSIKPFYRGASTPKYPKRGIDAVVDRSDRKVWMVKCEACGHWHDLAKIQELMFPLPDLESSNLIPIPNEEKGTHYHVGTRYYIACPECQRILNVWNGEWVATNTEHYSFGGYHIPKLISNRFAFDELAQRCEDQREGRMNDTQEQEFHNSDLGLPRAPKGSQLQLLDLIKCSNVSPEWFVFKSNGFESWYEFEERLQATFIGIDVAPRRVHISVIAFPAHNEVLRAISSDKRPVLIYCGTVRLDEKNTGFTELDNLIPRFNTIRLVIDRQPEMKNAAEYRKRHSGRVYTAQYINWKNKKNYIYDYDYDKGVVSAGRTETLDVVFQYILSQQIVLPHNVQYIGGGINRKNYGEFAQHFLNLTKIHDQDKDEYVYDDGKQADHFAHATNYAFIAAQISSLNTDEIKYVPDNVQGSQVRLGEETQLILSSISNAGARRGSRVARRSIRVGPGYGGY